jgi:CRP/FNR family transcriptional regulator, cyclic AMP receptor protein
MARRSQAQLVGVLEGVPLLANLTKKQLKAVAGTCIEVEFEPGQTLVKEMEDGQHLVSITSGTAKVVRNGRTIAKLGAGDVVGEMSLLDGEPRSATVVADGPVSGVVVHRTAFRRLLDEHPTMCSKLLLAQTARLRRLDKAAALYG